MNVARSITAPVTRINHDGVETDSDQLAIEAPLEIRINDEPVAITMRTPGHDRDLAAGFCLTENIVDCADDIESVKPCHVDDYGDIARVTLTDEAVTSRAGQIDRAARQLQVTSACGMCGKTSLDRIDQPLKPMADNFTVQRAVIDRLPQTMRDEQSTFDQTGGLHAAGLFDPTGRLIVLREDVGRHNAVDKVIGQRLLINAIPASHAILLVSGRTSFEIIQKAALAGIAFVAAVSAPSSMAVQLATQMNMTLVGFLRKDRMNVYHGVERIAP